MGRPREVTRCHRCRREVPPSEGRCRLSIKLDVEDRRTGMCPKDAYVYHTLCWKTVDSRYEYYCPECGKILSGAAKVQERCGKSAGKSHNRTVSEGGE